MQKWLTVWTASFQTAWRYKSFSFDIRQTPPSGQSWGWTWWKCTLDVPQVAERAHYNPSIFSFPFHPTYSHWGRSIRSLFQEPFFNFQNLFPPMPSFGRNFFGSMDPMMDFDTDANSNEGMFFFLPQTWNEKLTYETVSVSGCRRERQRGRGHHQTLRQRQDNLQRDPPQLGWVPQISQRVREMQRNPAHWWDDLSFTM